MVKVRKLSVCTPTGNVVEFKEIELESFDRQSVIRYGEAFDGYPETEDNIATLMRRDPGSHRSVVQLNDDIIIRYMDRFPQYYMKM